MFFFIKVKKTCFYVFYLQINVLTSMVLCHLQSGSRLAVTVRPIFGSDVSSLTYDITKNYTIVKIYRGEANFGKCVLFNFNRFFVKIAVKVRRQFRGGRSMYSNEGGKC